METIPKNHDDVHFMTLALKQAQYAFTRGEVPVGALVVQEDQIIAVGFNNRENDQDPTAHAELIAIRRAALQLGSWRMTGATVYVTLEPCAMCAGAMIQARVSRLVFGAFDPKAGACGSICHILAESRFNHKVAVESGVLDEECRSILQTFFRELREVG